MHARMSKIYSALLYTGPLQIPIGLLPLEFKFDVSVKNYEASGLDEAFTNDCKSMNELHNKDQTS